MTTPLTDQQLALRTALEAALRAAADQCTTDCPADCRTHHPSLFAGGMTATGLAESIDGDIDAVAHVAAITVQGEMDRLRAELEQARATVRQLAIAAENGKHSLAAFAADTTDPGSAALGALYLLRNALAGQPDIEPAYLEVTPERLRAAHFREAARLLEDAELDDDAVNMLDNVAHGIEQYNPSPGHQSHCAAATQGCCSCEEPST